MTPYAWLLGNGTVTALVALTLIVLGILGRVPNIPPLFVIGSGLFLVLISWATFTELNRGTWDSAAVVLGPGFTVLMVTTVTTFSIWPE